MESAIFYSFSIIIIALITFTIHQYLPPEKKNKSFLFPIVLIATHVIIAVLGENEFYIDFNMPPRFAYAGILPMFLILSRFVFSKIAKLLIEKVPTHFPVLFQSFRIVVELLIYWAFLHGFAPKEATMLGYNYEFYFGVLTIIIGVLVWKKKVAPRFIIAWNILGLAMLAIIIVIFFTSAFAYDTVWEYDHPIIDNHMLKPPYMAIPTLYMPLAVWMHIFSIKQQISRGK